MTWSVSGALREGGFQTRSYEDGVVRNETDGTVERRAHPDAMRRPYGKGQDPPGRPREGGFQTRPYEDGRIRNIQR